MKFLEMFNLVKNGSLQMVGDREPDKVRLLRFIDVTL